jgi:hypothetical protein
MAVVVVVASVQIQTMVEVPAVVLLAVLVAAVAVQTTSLPLAIQTHM